MFLSITHLMVPTSVTIDEENKLRRNYDSHSVKFLLFMDTNFMCICRPTSSLTIYLFSHGTWKRPLLLDLLPWNDLECNSYGNKVKEISLDSNRFWFSPSFHHFLPDSYSPFVFLTTTSQEWCRRRQVKEKEWVLYSFTSLHESMEISMQSAHNNFLSSLLSSFRIRNTIPSPPALFKSDSRPLTREGFCRNKVIEKTCKESNISRTCATQYQGVKCVTRNETTLTWLSKRERHQRRRRSQSYCLFHSIHKTFVITWRPGDVGLIHFLVTLDQPFIVPTVTTKEIRSWSGWETRPLWCFRRRRSKPFKRRLDVSI